MRDRHRPGRRRDLRRRPGSRPVPVGFGEARGDSYGAVEIRKSAADLAPGQENRSALIVGDSQTRVVDVELVKASRMPVKLRNRLIEIGRAPWLSPRR